MTLTPAQHVQLQAIADGKLDIDPLLVTDLCELGLVTFGPGLAWATTQKGLDVLEALK